MKYLFRLIIGSLALCSCTAIVEQRRPQTGVSQVSPVQAFKLARLEINDNGPSMCSDLKGDIFITDAGGWRVISYKNDGTINYESAIPSSRSFLLNGQANGIYVADDLNKSIRFSDAWGQKQNSISYSGSAFVSGAVLKDGSMYLLDNLANLVVVLNNMGTEARRFRLMSGNSGLQRLTALAVDGTGSVIATADAQSQKVTIFNGYGSYLGSIDVRPSTSPSALCFEPGTSVLWICQPDNNSLTSYEIKPSGIHPRNSCDISNPLSVTCSAFGNIFVASDQYLWNVTEK
jgi:hypothetical protein